MKLWRMLHDLTISWNSSMTVSKPEVPISHLVDMIRPKFQPQYQCFRGPAILWERDYYECCTTESEVWNPIWRPPNRKDPVLENIRPLEFRPYHVTSWDMGILSVWRPLYPISNLRLLHCILNSFIGLLDLENSDITVGIPFLSCLQAGYAKASVSVSTNRDFRPTLRAGVIPNNKKKCGPRPEQTHIIIIIVALNGTSSPRAKKLMKRN